MGTTIDLKNIPVSYSKDFNYPYWKGEYPNHERVDANIEWLEEVVIDEPSITMRFSYPLSGDVFFDFDAPEEGFTRRELINAIRLAYHYIYEEETRTSSVEEMNMEPLANRNETNGSYGVCCHGIGDLVIDSVVNEGGIQYHPIILS